MIGGAAIGTYKQLHGHFHLPASRVRKQLGDAAFTPYFSSRASTSLIRSVKLLRRSQINPEPK